MTIFNCVHPYFSSRHQDWRKWRLTYEGGQRFIHAFLERFSKREDRHDFHLRKRISYSPSFAKAALNEVKNAIYQRTSDVIRIDGPKSYLESVKGLNGGVDRSGSAMNTFVGIKILPELLSMSKVGVFIDMPRLDGPTIADKGDKKPYIYSYCAEQIKNWSFDPDYPDRLNSLVLEDNVYTNDQYGLPNSITTRTRHLWIEDNALWAQFYDYSGKAQEKVNLGLSRIPFVIFELPESLFSDAANYQIALLNLESSDLFYALRSNFPFYTEQFDSKSESLYLKQPGKNPLIKTGDGDADDLTENANEVKVGIAAGRRYPLGTERPGFIHPSSEPLKASMEKGEQIKKDMRLLINLAISNLSPKMASADSKGMDNQSLENGLAYIGLELERGERQIAEIWSEYEAFNQVSTVTYPTNYSLKTEEDRQKEVTYYEGLLPKLPSKTFQKEIAKVIVDISLNHKISALTLNKIKSEIDTAEVIISDPDIIKTDLENGLVGNKLASKIRGYPEGEVEIAEQDHANRVARIAIAQTQGMAAESRGVSDLGANTQSGSQEKAASRDTTTDESVTSKVRGSGA